MFYIEQTIYCIMIVLFPILLYFIISCCLNEKVKKYNDIIFKITLCTSLYFCLRNVNIMNNNYFYLLCNIPIILAYLKKDKYLGMLLSSFLIFYCYSRFDLSIIILILKYIIYYIVYLIYKKFSYSSIFFIELIAMLQGFFLTFEYFSGYQDNYKLIFEAIIVISIFYIITFFSIIIVDQTDKIMSLFTIEKELEKEKKIKASLFKITHEIKNPIAVCKGYLDMLDINNQDKVSRYIPIISQEIERCLNIMTDFMELSKIKLNKEILDINMLLEEVENDFKLLLGNNINLKYNVLEEEIYIDGDYNRIKQVMLNIIKNSAEAVNEKGLIQIKGYKKSKDFYIEVEDNGCGMDNDTLKRINELFFTTKKNGTGVGVSLSQEIIIAHNGSINYESELGKGTKVIIKLPLLKME